MFLPMNLESKTKEVTTKNVVSEEKSHQLEQIIMKNN
jgi:hypothetical protein